MLSVLSAAGCGGGSGGDKVLIPDSGQNKPPPVDAGGGGTGTGGGQQPDPPPPPPVDNVIERENAKTALQGVTTDWIIADEAYAANREIEGYASATSVRRGETIKLYVHTVEPTYSISVYRVGWYGGKGGRLVAGPVQRNGVRQTMPTAYPQTRLVECNWTDPYVLTVPENRNDPTDWASGVYLAKLTGGASGKQSYIIFVVRDDRRENDLLFQCSVTTYAAYNNWGGYNFYDVNSNGGKPAWKLSFNRPYRNPQRPYAGKGAGDFLSWELQMLRFIEREGYDASYCTNIDVDVAPARLLKHRGFLSVGHDEYWTKNMRDAIQAARDGGVDLGFFGANTGYWQVRLEPDANDQPDRTLVCYKYDTPDADPLYASNPTLATGLWRAQADGRPARPEAALIGVMYDYNSVDLDMVMSDCSSWICDGAGLSNGAVLRGMLGYEVDRVDPASSPAGIQVLASSPYVVCMSTACTASEAPTTPPKSETRYAHMTYYTSPSGAGVFATGSMQWNWGVDNFGPRGDRVNPAVQQMTRNVLNRFSM
jgi:hypothetical protein